MYLQSAVVITSEPPVRSVAMMRSGAMETVSGLGDAAAAGERLSSPGKNGKKWSKIIQTLIFPVSWKNPQ